MPEIVEIATVSLLYQGVGAPDKDPLPLPSKWQGGTPEGADFVSKNYQTLIEYDIQGWRGARDFMCDFADRLIVALGGPAAEVAVLRHLVWVARENGLEPPKTKGPNPYANAERDFAIANTVRRIVEITRLHPLRDRRKKTNNNTESACSVVATALQRLRVSMSEDNVAAIWNASDKGRSLGTLLGRSLKRSVLATERRRPKPAGRRN